MLLSTLMTGMLFRWLEDSWSGDGGREEETKETFRRQEANTASAESRDGAASISAPSFHCIPKGTCFTFDSQQGGSGGEWLGGLSVGPTLGEPVSQAPQAGQLPAPSHSSSDKS